jgi:hypothetical protein
MSAPAPSSPRSGGALLAAAILLGILVGTAFGEPSIGFLAGLGVGGLLLLLVWVLDRRARR